MNNFILSQSRAKLDLKQAGLQHQPFQQKIGKNSSTNKNSFKLKVEINQSTVRSSNGSQSEQNNSNIIDTQTGSERVIKQKLYPAGRKQRFIQKQALILYINASFIVQQLNSNSDSFQKDFEYIIQEGGFSDILLVDQEQKANDIYKAANFIVDFVRNRVNVLILDRSDVCQALSADGVILSQQGLPVVVAKKVLGDKAYIVGSYVASVDDAVQAQKDGSGLILFEINNLQEIGKLYNEAQQKQTGGRIPVIPLIKLQNKQNIQDLQIQNYDGISVSLQNMLQINQNNVSEACNSLQMIRSLMDQAPVIEDKETIIQKGEGGLLQRVLKLDLNAYVEEEKQLLNQILNFLQEELTQVQDIKLLKDAIKQLDENFLVMVVGEFNTGKSTVINALLGNTFLEEGVLPTTNIINILKYKDEQQSKDSDVKQVSSNGQQSSEGYELRFLNAELLQQLTIVDTPGTNVILERQQQLTEEYVPKADLILFVMSCDRPLTDSEINFLRYIREWKKKVIFVVNKIDILKDSNEINKVQDFVKVNISRLLNLSQPNVIGVSGRLALNQKLQQGSGTQGGILNPNKAIELQQNTEWQKSGFYRLENFMLQLFMGLEGSKNNDSKGLGGESARLKLQTPLVAAQALLDSCGQQLDNIAYQAQTQIAELQLIEEQIQIFRKEVLAESLNRRRQVEKLVQKSVSVINQLIDNTLNLSNPVSLVKIALGQEVLVPRQQLSFTEMRRKDAVFQEERLQILKWVVQHGLWLHENCDLQLQSYRQYIETNFKQRNVSKSQDIQEFRYLKQPNIKSLQSFEQSNEAEQLAKETTQSTYLPQQLQNTFSQPVQNSMAILQQFDPSAAWVLLQNEIKEVVSGFVTKSAAFFTTGVILSQLVGTFQEDLLSLGTFTALSYISALGIPLNRGRVNSKIDKVSTNFLNEAQKQLELDFDSTVESCVEEVQQLIQPFIQQAQKELELATKQKQQIEDYQQKIDQQIIKINKIE